LTGESIDGLPAATFDQCDAITKGIEGSIEVDLARWLSVKMHGDALQTQNQIKGAASETSTTKNIKGWRIDPFLI